ncbi:MAG: hypothetical protein VST72_08320 [Nitrospirota bacterium]|nr:hypothetical protein [Nitrospirota bacterium]
MKMSEFTYKILGLLLITLISACSGGSTSDVPSGVGGGGGGGGVIVGNITVTANLANVTVGGTVSITATVLDDLAAPVPDGTTVSFSLSPSNLGTITSQATTGGGVATATFTAYDPGTVTVTGSAGGLSDSVDITIDPAATGSIEFDSAVPNVIAITGTGGTETSLVSFIVKDIYGDPVVDGTLVDFVMTGPGGGEYIGDNDATPNEHSVSTVTGVAAVYLNSGTVAGTVQITATVTLDGTTMSSTTTQVSIGGGVPSDAHLSIATERFNLEGLVWFGIETNILVFMSDRFKNYNILEGTSVSFTAESGAIDTSNVTDADGYTSVVYRTQLPYPEDVAPEAWETALQSQVLADYGILTTAHPRDGWATIMASTRGEEAFDDSDGNGAYDTGEVFTDTPQEAYIDVNDNGAWDDGTGVDPFEIYMDDDLSSTYDGLNGVWDSDKTIFTDIRLLITGEPEYIVANPASFTILDGGFQSFRVIVCDQNLNALIGGTTVKISADGGKFSGVNDYTFPDLFIYGPVELDFVLSDANPGDTDPAEAVTITIDVVYKTNTWTTMVTGTID